MRLRWKKVSIIMLCCRGERVVFIGKIYKLKLVKGGLWVLWVKDLRIRLWSYVLGEGFYLLCE